MSLHIAFNSPFAATLPQLCILLNDTLCSSGYWCTPL